MIQITNKKRLILCLSVLIIGAILFIYFKWNPSNPSHFFPSCPSKSIFNFYCPGCGSQRAIHSLLNGEFQQAWRYNPALLILGPLGIVLIIQFILRNFFNFYWRIRIFENNKFLFFLLICLILYMILRNIPSSHFDFLRPRTIL